MGVFTESLGILAACLTTASFVPQAILTVRTRDTSGISFLMFAMFTFGVLVWAGYGVLIGSWPVILANLVTGGFAGTILLIKVQNMSRGNAGLVGEESGSGRGEERVG